MTNSEAINVLSIMSAEQKAIDKGELIKDDVMNSQELEAITMAISALEENEKLKAELEKSVKVGDTVYAIVNNKIVTDVVDRIEQNKLCTKISTEKHSWLCNIENAFHSREEAEQALAERQGK